MVERVVVEVASLRNSVFLFHSFLAFYYFSLFLFLFLVLFCCVLPHVRSTVHTMLRVEEGAQSSLS